MEKRLILAIALSLLVVVTFQHLFAPPRKKAEKPPSEPALPREAESEKSYQPTPFSYPEEKEFDVETDRYIITFSNVGGSIKRIKLKDYRVSETGLPLDIVEIKDPSEYIFAVSETLSSQSSLDRLTYEVEARKDGAICRLKTKDLEIVKRYILHNSKHIIELGLLIKNLSSEQKEFTYSIVGGSNVVEPNIQDKRFVEVVSKLDGRVANFKRPRNKITTPGIVEWIALKNKYFSIILKPLVQTKSQFYYGTTEDSLVNGIAPQPTTIPPNHFIENKFILYAGPNKEAALKEFGLEESLSYGFFGGISKMLLSVLAFFFKWVRNWGISIILLSIFLNLLFFPLTIKSFKSMQKMQALHPQMERLKTQYKDNPQKLNKEIMELYKKERVNPFSGCLPLLLQMPIFIALYQALIKHIELKNAKFLWIEDLSLPDAVRIPVQLPIVGNSINILPILMVIAMVLQQKMSTKTMGSAITDEQKQQQRIMLIIMPVMFGFIFYNMPSGLVLYWVTNTILTISEQYMMLKKA